MTFRQNIGLILARRTKELSGELCRDCLGQVFREYTLLTAVAGWWGLVSLLVTPLYLARNLAQFWGSRGLARPAPDAEKALAVAERTRPLVDARAEWINARFKQGCGLSEVASELARMDGLDPVAVEVTLRLLAR